MKQEELHLRPAVIEDMDLLYKWRNEEICRKNSINKEYITYDNHCKWYIQKLNSKNCIIFICIKNDGSVCLPIGQARIDYEKHEIGKISYSIDAGYRCNGYGTRILKLLEYNKDVLNNISKLCAVVEKNNIASQKCFENLKYLKNIKDGMFYYTKNLVNKIN